MGEDPSIPSSLEKQLEQLREKLQDLEALIARQTQRIHALELKTDGHSHQASGAEQTPTLLEPTGPHQAVKPSELSPIISSPVPALSGLLNLFPATQQPSASTDAASTSESEKASWEARIGGRWLLWIGIVATVLGTAYFLKLAFENAWVGTVGRVTIDLLIGAAFFLWGEALQKHKYPYYGQIVTGGGGAILYLSAYAAFNTYHIISAAVSFAFMIVVTAVISILAARYSSRALAFMGLIGGFLTPYWLNTGEDHQIILLSYLAVLVAGIAALAHRHRWMILNYTSYVLTILLFGEWAFHHYTTEKRGATEFFLCVFAGMFFYVGREVLSQVEGWTRGAIKNWIGFTLFLFFVATSVNLFRHGVELWSVLLVFDALMLLLALRLRRGGIGLGTFLLTAACFFEWLNLEYGSGQFVSTLVFVAAFYVLFAIWPLLCVFQKKMAAGRADLVLTTLNALGSFGAAYFLMSEGHRTALGLLAVCLGGIYFSLAQVLWKRKREEKRLVLITLGVAITFVTLAIPIQLRQNWITLSWAVEAVILTWVGVRTLSVKMHQTSWAVLGLTVARLFLFDRGIPVESFLVVFNRRFFTFLVVIVVCYGIAWMLRKAPAAFAEKTRLGFRAAILLASILTVALMTLEVAGYYSTQRFLLSERLRSEGARVYNFEDVFRPIESAKQVAYSVIWGIYSIVLIVVGIVKRFRDIRWFAMVLFALTIAKVFVVISSLGMVYRTLSMTMLGAVLLLAAYLYQHYRKVIL